MYHIANHILSHSQSQNIMKRYADIQNDYLYNGKCEDATTYIDHNLPALFTSIDSAVRF